MRSSAEQTAATPENTGVAAIYKVKLKRGTFFNVKNVPPAVSWPQLPLNSLRSLSGNKHEGPHPKTVRFEVGSTRLYALMAPMPRTCAYVSGTLK